MRPFHLVALCAVGILAGSAQAQQNYIPVVNVGGGYRLSTGAPYYRPGYAASPYYYSPAVSPAFYARGFPPPGFTPARAAYNGAAYSTITYSSVPYSSAPYSNGASSWVYDPAGAYYLSGYYGIPRPLGNP